MNRYRLVLLFLALTGTLLSGSVKAGLLDDYPQEASPFVLSTGEEVYLPLHVSNLWGMAIIGTIDLDEASAGMNAQNLYPIEVGNNKGLAIVYVLDYREAGLGPYQEIITLIAVTSDAKASVAENLIGFGSSYFPKLKGFLEGDMPDTGVYFERISLDSTLAITTGIEIWGIPKTYEQLSIENTFWKTSVATSEVSFQLNKEFGLFTPLQLNLTSWTPMDYEQTRAETLLKGWGRMGLVGSNDTFELGDNLSRLDFTPVVWQEILPGTDAVFFEGAVPDLLEISE
ncbi:hypothetical protein A9Q99_00725 [Gammaproteobacteria bacterium 45_16_T64]|nr:hypothetical protein A9Q99_00725 [Gammaproteobacteria bacterium 45_16_T64]